MLQKSLATLAALFALFTINPAFSQISLDSAPLGYADLADLSVDAPLVIEAQVKAASRLKPERAPGLRAGYQRFYVEAQVLSLVRGQGGIGGMVNYIMDMPMDSRGRTASLKKRHVLLFARPVSGSPGSVQLVAPDAQIDWTPAAMQTVRGILSQAVAPDAPPRITGVGSAFHSVGTIPGEGETQIFLNTANGAPVSLSIVRRPGQQPRWAVALGEIVDESAAAPAPGSLLWYRLACFLPRELPGKAVASLAASDAAAARADYQLVLGGLGPCGRTRQPAR